MIDPKTLDEMTRRLVQSLPAGLSTLQQDLEKNFRAVIEASIQRLDLVTREEFEVQAEVLARTREKLEALEARVTRIEEALGSVPSAEAPPGD